MIALGNLINNEEYNDYGDPLLSAWASGKPGLLKQTYGTVYTPNQRQQIIKDLTSLNNKNQGSNFGTFLKDAAQFTLDLAKIAAPIYVKIYQANMQKKIALRQLELQEKLLRQQQNVQAQALLQQIQALKQQVINTQGNQLPPQLAQQVTGATLRASQYTGTRPVGYAPQANQNDDKLLKYGLIGAGALAGTGLLIMAAKH